MGYNISPDLFWNTFNKQLKGNDMAIDFEQDSSVNLGLAEKVEFTPQVSEIEIVQGPEEVGTENQPKEDKKNVRKNNYDVILP